MYRLLFTFLGALTLIFYADLQAQDSDSFTRPDEVREILDEELAPFYHGVASGDPTQNSVIIWTRVTPESFDGQDIEVAWYISTTPEFDDIVSTGTFTTNEERDYTVKVDVEGLEPQTTYYYAFDAEGVVSIPGRTRTTATTADHLRFAIVSCSNYQHGYFDSYSRIAERNDLDAVIHLGDYIYEYGEHTDTFRQGIQPQTEILELLDYRTRHSFYKLDSDLRNIHQQHPIICTWDDHEVANDSWVNGAENHEEEEGEGDYQDRKTAAKQAYFEWMPIRDNDTRSVHRSVNYGDLAELLILDTRHHARMEQVADLTEEELYAEGRTILGADQHTWLLDRLENSDAQWKILGNQVIFSPLKIEAIPVALSGAIIRDIWQGYPAERDGIISFIDENEIDDIVIVTGDIHASFAVDVPSDTATYVAETGENAIAVELVTPSISSNNYDEYLGETGAMNIENFLMGENPHIKTADVSNHGYFILDITEEKAQADWFFDPAQKERNDDQIYAMGMITMSGQNHLQETSNMAAEKSIQEAPAPLVADINSSINTISPEYFTLLSAHYMNEQNSIWFSYALNDPTNFQLILTDMTGQVLLDTKLNKTPGLYQMAIPTQSLQQGMYILSILSEKGKLSKKIVVK